MFKPQKNQRHTSTSVVQAEEPNQQKRDILPISSVRSLFCITKKKNMLTQTSPFSNYVELDKF